MPPAGAIMSTESRHMRTGSLNIPPGAGRPTNHHSKPGNNPSLAAPGTQRFDGPRSPPNTSHVPCKFFRQGTCQAGNACPFSHDLGLAEETICKYFAKGNCKFGPKCANIHVLPDGRRVNYSKNGFSIGGAVGGHGRGGPFNSALTSGFMRSDGSHPYPPSIQYSAEEGPSHQLTHRQSMDNGLPIIDTPYSHPSSAYGSPRDEERPGLGLSPVPNGGLSVLDAPLPASFDSNGISVAARYGPWPSSVPSKFGTDSPSSFVNAAKEGRTSETLKLLHNSAFGPGHLSPTPSQGIPAMGSSPPTGPTEEYFGKRAMHSSNRLFMTKKGGLTVGMAAVPGMLAVSSSLPKQAGAIDRDWDLAFPFLEEAEYVPSDLKDLLTPMEQARRSSLRAIDPHPGVRANGHSGNGEGNQATNGSSASPFTADKLQVGSPNGVGATLATSPGSRWGPLFQHRNGAGSNGAVGGGEADYLDNGLSSSAARRASAFGHVGSPLRNSSLARRADDSPSSPSGGDNHNGRPVVSSRPSDDGVSVLSQQLARSRLSSGDRGTALEGDRSPGASGSPRINARRHMSNGSGGSGNGGSSSARYTTTIDEEDDAPWVFSMDDVGSTSNTVRKRSSLGLGWTLPPARTAAPLPPRVDGSPAMGLNGSGQVTSGTVGGERR